MERLHKMKSQAGFTLAETLLAVLILLLVSGIVATGVPVARNVYEKVVLSANAQVMLSTAVDALKSEIGTAWKVVVQSEQAITYYSAGTGWQSEILLNNTPPDKDRETGREYTPIKITEYIVIHDGGIIYSSGSTEQQTHSLVPDTSSKMYVACGKIARKSDDNVVIFSEIKVCKKADNKVLASLNELEVRVISGDVENLTPGS